MTGHACEVFAEIGTCPPISPVPDYLQPVIDAINRLIVGFRMLPSDFTTAA